MLKPPFLNLPSESYSPGLLRSPVGTAYTVLEANFDLAK